MPQDKINGKNQGPNIVDMHTALAHRLIRYLLTLFGPLGVKDGLCNSCIRLARNLENNLGWDYQQDLYILSKLKELLDKAEASNRGEDLDTTTARHLRPIRLEAWKEADKIIKNIEIEPEKEKVIKEDYTVSGGDYFGYHEIYLYHRFIRKIGNCLKKHYMFEPQIKEKSIIRFRISKYQKTIKYVLSPTGIIASVSLVFMFLLVMTSWNLYSDESFKLNLLSEAHGLVAELILVGVVLAILERKSRTTEKNDEEIKNIIRDLSAMRSYPGSDSIKEKARLIRSLTKLIPSNDIDLSEMVLQGADLAGCTLKGVNFERAVLDGANLSNTDLSQADMSRASLIGCDFSLANIEETNFNSANLSSCNLITTRNPIESKSFDYSTKNNTMIHPSLKGYCSYCDNVRWVTDISQTKRDAH